ncbi:MAG: hypothetical protein QS721_00075 [Candidatus Endonucleobacter sp. (ex Gigantidas childressi)]|nr:hypothetical protein [Candidatus Endonucleobacter sp. (ex Gigantidas childressi)]
MKLSEHTFKGNEYIPVAFQVATLLTAFAHPDYLLLCRLTGLPLLAA